MLLRDMLMSPSAVLPVVRQGELSAAALVIIGQDAKCILQYALDVVKPVKYPSSLERVGRCIVVSATTKLN
jgi:hypothetical protein